MAAVAFSAGMLAAGVTFLMMMAGGIGIKGKRSRKECPDAFIGIPVDARIQKNPGLGKRASGTAPNAAADQGLHVVRP